MSAEVQLSELNAALATAEAKFGKDSLEVADVLENYSRLLRELRVRSLDAANMQARAQVIRERAESNRSVGASDATQLRALLQSYVGRDIGVNVKEANKFHKVRLLKVAESFFTVQLPNNALLFHYPLTHVLCVVEGREIPVSTDGFVVTAPRVPLVVQTFSTSSGPAFGFGISVPL